MICPYERISCLYEFKYTCDKLNLIDKVKKVIFNTLDNYILQGEVK